MSAQAQKALYAQDDGEKDWETQQVVEVVVDEPAADVVGLEQPAGQAIENHRRNANGVGEVAEAASRGHFAPGRVVGEAYGRLAGRLTDFSGHCGCT